MAEEKKPFNAGDPESVKNRKTEAQDRVSMQIEGLNMIMNNRFGRSWMYHLLEFTHLHETSCVEFNAKVYFREGERNVGLKVLADIMKRFPDQYLLMIKENQNAT